MNLPTAEELRAQAARIRKAARYANGQAYWDDIEAANKLEYQAQVMDNIKPRVPEVEK